MPEISSARKKFQMLRLKTTLLQMSGLPDDQADAQLVEMEKSLVKTFGQEDANEMLEEAIAAADTQFSDALDSLAKSGAIPKTVEAALKAATAEQPPPEVSAEATTETSAAQ